MSVVIIGGNERMERQYKNICREYKCKAKVFTKTAGSFQKKIGRPDLMVLFTNTVSHKMTQNALGEVKGRDTVVVRTHSSSGAALKCILDKFATGGGICQSR